MLRESVPKDTERSDRDALSVTRRVRRGKSPLNLLADNGRESAGEHSESYQTITESLVMRIL